MSGEPSELLSLWPAQKPAPRRPQPARAWVPPPKVQHQPAPTSIPPFHSCFPLHSLPIPPLARACSALRALRCAPLLCALPAHHRSSRVGPGAGRRHTGSDRKVEWVALLTGWTFRRTDWLECGSDGVQPSRLGRCSLARALARARERPGRTDRASPLRRSPWPSPHNNNHVERASQPYSDWQCSEDVFLQ